MARRTVVDCDLCKASDVGQVIAVQVPTSEAPASPVGELYDGAPQTTQVDLCVTCAQGQLNYLVGQLSTAKGAALVKAWAKMSG